MKLFQWHANSFYIDSILFCIFSNPFNTIFDNFLKNLDDNIKQDKKNKYKRIVRLLQAISKLIQNKKDYPLEYYESHTSLITELRYALAEMNDFCCHFKPADNVEEKKTEMNDPHEFLQYLFFDLLDMHPFIECTNTIYLPHSSKIPLDRIVAPININGHKYIQYN